MFYKILQKSMTLFWAIALAFGFGVFVSIYPFNQTDYQRHRFFEAVYLATYRHAWALFIGWIVYACVSGNGGNITHFIYLINLNIINSNISKIK